MPDQLTHFSLFSGIGGLDLAAEAAGFETVGFCEQNKFCQQILGLRWPGVPVFDDIFSLTIETLGRRGIRPGGIKLLTGGFPCQPFSSAGQRMGSQDDRYLWPEMLRVIGLLRPTWVVGENVAGILSMEFPFDVSDLAVGPSETVLAGIRRNLKAIGYDTRVFVFPACAVGAPHRRDRVFIVAHDTGVGRGENANASGQWEADAYRGREDVAYTERFGGIGRWQCESGIASPSKRAEDQRDTPDLPASRCGETLADPTRRNAHRHWIARNRLTEPANGRPDATDPERQGLAFGSGTTGERPLAATAGSDWWSTEPDVGRTFDGLSSWLDRALTGKAHECIMTNGIDNIINSLGGTPNADATEAGAREVLRMVWGEDGEAHIQRATGGFENLHATQVLQPILCQFTQTPETLGDLPLQSKEAYQNSLRSLWSKDQFNCSSYRPEPGKQRGGEYPDFMQVLSRLLALHSQAKQAGISRSYAKPLLNPWDGDWERGTPRVAHGVPHRVDRLRGLGNAVVWQQAYPVFEGIARYEAVVLRGRK
jgi:DNA (cytosine-5)-methyltransferase 1